MLRLALLFAVIVVAFDAIAAFVANAAGFNYGQFALISVVIYVALGIFAGQRLRRFRALTAIVIAALVDASLGSYVAASIGRDVPTVHSSTMEIVGAALLGALLNIAFGTIGVVVGARVARRSL
ncbi:MAG: hypothetical protein WB615_00175 [Candidatus Tumulicola sp.]